MTALPTEAIVVQYRVRRDLGDIEALAESIKTHGLLHPIVVRSDNTLVAGQRRLEAVRLLGWREVPVTVIDVEDMLLAESDENQRRKDFTPSEMYELGKLLEPAVRERAKQRQRESGPESVAKRGGSVTVTEPSDQTHRDHETREIVGRAVGVSGPTYQRIKALGEAATADPENYGDLMAKVEQGDLSISGAHDELSDRKARNGASTRCKPKPAKRPEHLKGTRRIDPNRVFQSIVDDAATLSVGQSLRDFNAIDLARIPGWVSSLEESIRFLTTLKRRLNKELTRDKQ